jgi:hypothetical protein
VGAVHRRHGDVAALVGRIATDEILRPIRGRPSRGGARPVQIVPHLVDRPVRRLVEVAAPGRIEAAERRGGIVAHGA